MAEAEIVARRRRWTAEEKAALLAEVEAEGGRVSVVARRHGLSDSLLYNWRSAWKAAASVRASAASEFMRLGVTGPADEEPVLMAASAPVRPAGMHATDRVGVIEIELAGGTRVRVDAFVNEKALARVFRAMKGVP